MNLEVRAIIDTLIQRRKEAGLSQSELARIMHVRPSTINHFENLDRQHVSTRTLFRYAAALGYHVRMEIVKHGNEVQLRDPNRPHP